MSEQVPFQVDSLTKWFAALCTIVWFNLRMSEQVFFSMFHLDWMICCILHTCVIFLQREESCAFSGYLPEQMICCIEHTCVSFLLNWWAYDPLDFQFDQMFSRIDHIHKGCLHCCGSSHRSQGLNAVCLWTQVSRIGLCHLKVWTLCKEWLTCTEKCVNLRQKII